MESRKVKDVEKRTINQLDAEKQGLQVATLKHIMTINLYI
jgi:hypothetical protein